MSSFTIRGFSGFLKIEIKEVFGFPHQTSHYGGYDTKSSFLVESNGFSVDSELWLSTGEIFNLYKELKAAHQNLKGTAKFDSSEGNLSFTVNYIQTGQVSLIGEFRDNNLEDNFLRFEIPADQSYLNRTLAELGQLNEKFGDEYGKKS